MPTPKDRVPVRPLRGLKADLTAAESGFKDGELTFDTDTKDLRVAMSGTLGAKMEATGGIVGSDTTQAGGGTQVDNIVTISQAAYDLLTPDASTIYIIE